jgi:predicted ribosome quality control (RQC) complex YloA/Tae2 family protein
MKLSLFSRVVKELADLIPGARLERVYQGTDGFFYLLFHREKKKYVLLISPDRTLPRLHLIDGKTAAAANAHSFALYLRSHLARARVVAVSQLNQDRVVEIRFTKAAAEYRLVFELIGASTNLILTDGFSKIVAVYYPSPITEQSIRTLIPGLQYALPEKKNLVFSPLSLHDALTPSENISDLPANREAANYYQQLHDQKELAALKRELSSRIQKVLLKTERRRAALSKDLISADKADEYRQAGNLVLANLKKLRTGVEQATLEDYDGSSIVVRLDPRFSPTQNADRFFKKYKKAKKGRSIMLLRLSQAQDEALLLKNLLASLHEAKDVDEVFNVRSSLAAGGYLIQKENHRAYAEPTTPGFRKIIFRGWDILVGKGAAGNDYLTTKIARPDDLWLHAEGMPGSHVLVKNPGKREIPGEVLLKAASLAAYYSKGKSAAKVSVTYTAAKFVKKPKAAKPGLVVLSERKSIMVQPEAQ